MEGVNLLKCSNESVGAANALFGHLLSTILTAQCTISPTSMWPNDYGQIVLEKGARHFKSYVCLRHD